MTDKQIEERALEAYPEETYSITGEELREGYIKGYTEAKKEIESLPKIKCWIARDKYINEFWGNGLVLHYSKPVRKSTEWSSNTIAMHLPDEMFPEITWESEPKEVELIIRIS